MRFTFATAGQIIFGPGTVRELPTFANALGNRAFVVVGTSLDRHAGHLDRLREAGQTITTTTVPGEPTIEMARRHTEAARQANADVVIGIGGGSVIDMAKAVAVLLSNGGDPLDYLEIIGHGRPLTVPARPCIAVPTTAGTGSEVTHNAVLASPKHRVKASLRSPSMLPRIAIVDPELTLGLPAPLTAATGLDALTQLIEPLLSPLGNPLTDGICREGIALAARSLRQAVDEPTNLTARTELAAASLFGGLALANAKLGAVHGFAGPLGGMFDAPHGALCGRLLPATMAVNLAAVNARQRAAVAKFTDVARILTTDPTADANAGVRWLDALVESLAVPRLSAYGITRADFPAILPKARAASSMKGNPVALTDAELLAILDAAL